MENGWFSWAYLKFRALRAPGEVTILSVEGFGMTWRPGDILRTSQAKDVGLKKKKSAQYFVM